MCHDPAVAPRAPKSVSGSVRANGHETLLLEVVGEHGYLMPYALLCFALKLLLAQRGARGCSPLTIPVDAREHLLYNASM